MKYMGSKRRILKHILPVMLRYRQHGQAWVEPFVGGANCFDSIEDGPRIGSDINPNVISALKMIRDFPNELPKSKTEFTEKDYHNISPDNRLYGYVGFALSYGGKWRGGWRRDGLGKRDYVAEAYRNAILQSKKLQNTALLNCGYWDLSIPKNSIIYCDPPYQLTTGYSGTFNHSVFWEWCRRMHREGHTIFISEYSAPEDFIAVWEGKINSSLTKNTGGKMGMEKLFIPRPTTPKEENI